MQVIRRHGDPGQAEPLSERHQTPSVPPGEERPVAPGHGLLSDPSPGTAGSSVQHPRFISEYSLTILRSPASSTPVAGPVAAQRTPEEIAAFEGSGQVISMPGM